MAEIIVSLSGGMDSATLLAKAALVEKHGNQSVMAVGFLYSSKHNKYEQAAAHRLCTHYSVQLHTIDLRQAMAGITSNLMQSGGNVPEGHYQEESMRQTVVPGRNIIFIAHLAGFAWSHGAREIWVGVHGGDHFIYPDCRPEFIEHMAEAVVHGTDWKIALQAPFLRKTKADILKEGLELKVPYEKTRTCYKDQPIACGKCGSCQERLEAFKLLGTEDPLEYESRELMPKRG